MGIKSTAGLSFLIQTLYFVSFQLSVAAKKFAQRAGIFFLCKCIF